ncbi:hypothetical protein SAMN02910368_02385 [Lachnospiraceae bacterium G11]|nr:hypothetical protein SAMN02910368_02385 [Lachnospiraceae bacterium G11]
MKNKTKVSIVAAILISVITFGSVVAVNHFDNDTELGYSVTGVKLVDDYEDWTRKS